MTNKIKIFACFTLCFLFVSQIQAQLNPPSQEEVESLLEGIDACKQGAIRLEKNLKDMEDNPGSFTLEEYYDMKKYIQINELCLKAIRAELDRLRKIYPQWFNQPGAEMPVNKGNVHKASPGLLEKLVAALEAGFDAILKRMEKIPKPK